MVFDGGDSATNLLPSGENQLIETRQQNSQIGSNLVSIGKHWGATGIINEKNVQFLWMFP